MEKLQLLQLYEVYLQNNPQEIYVKNIKHPSVYDNPIDRMYIQRNGSLADEIIPDDLTFNKLFSLDESCNHTLTWKILESGVTDRQIAEYEQKNGMTLPQMFREYLQGYTVLQWCFYPKCVVSEGAYSYCSGYYDQTTGERVGFSDEELEQEEVLIGNVQIDFYGLSNPTGLKEYEYLKNIRQIHIGTLDNADMVFLDCDTGEVQSWDHEMSNAWDAESKEEFEEESEMGAFWFKDFDAFLEWVYGKTVYDFEKSREEQYEFYKSQE